MQFKTFCILFTLLFVAGCGSSGSLVKTPTTSHSGINFVSLSIDKTKLHEYGSTGITITASSLTPAQDNIVVTLGHSGTATDGTDHSTIGGNTITIPKGMLTGSISVTPINDTVSEGLESATISILSISGGAKELGTQSVTFTVSEGLNAGINLPYNFALEQLNLRSDEFKFMGVGGNSEITALELINAHKAAGYGLTGEDIWIGILDSGYNTAHQEFSRKEIVTVGTLGAASMGPPLSVHGTQVAGYAAAQNDGFGMQGVAPNADMYWGTHVSFNGHTYLPDSWGWQLGQMGKAVVVNNSWGPAGEIQVFKRSMLDSGDPPEAMLASVFTNIGWTSNAASVLRSVQAWDDFQKHGVVIFALSNTSSDDNADVLVGMPEFWPQLEEAWLTAVNIETRGQPGVLDTTTDDVGMQYTRMSAPCGDTAPYCMGADGWQITAPTWSDTNARTLYSNGSGTSFVAPQLSGAIALMAEAFPNQSPAHWRDRLLATADNSFFPHIGVKTFSNGWQHGYGWEFGHGILDLYAALQPITSSGQTGIFVGNNTTSSRSYAFNASTISTSRSFGDSLYRGLKGLSGYTYDDFGGGFKYPLTHHVNMPAEDVSSIDIAAEISKIPHFANDQATPNWKREFDRVIANFSSFDTLNTAVTVGSTSIPVQSFFQSNLDTAVELSKFQTPYLTSGDKGLGIGTNYQMGDTRLLVGLTMPFDSTNKGYLGDTKTFTTSVEHGSQKGNAVTIMAGATQEQDKLLGSVGEGAFSLTGSRTDTTFATLKAQTQLFDTVFLTGVTTIAQTSMSAPHSSLIGGSNNIRSSSHGLILNKRALLGDDNLSVFVSQPDRINHGTMTVRVPSLADRAGNITYNAQSINLEPSGHQIDSGISYRKNVSDNFSFALKHLVTSNPNHVDTNKTYHSSFAGLRYNNTRLGFASNPFDSGLEFKLTYYSQF